MATLTHMPTEHLPVLAPELVALTEPAAGETAVDCTYGAGGHARMMAARLGPTGTLVCIDRDPVAEQRFSELAAERPCELRFERADFADALEDMSDARVEVDIVYLDLGVSSLQLDVAERGFSYSYDAPLDMRMDPEQELSAREVVNEWPTARLAQTLRDYGEERYARAIAAGIAARRPFESTGELVDAIRAAVPPAYRFGRGHPAKRTFQAIRIAVNDELASLDRALPAAWRLLRPGGRLTAIAFHSLEDRRVKRFLAERARACICPPELPVCRCGGQPEAELLGRGGVAPSAEEIERNPRASSARLRCARKLREGR